MPKKTPNRDKSWISKTNLTDYLRCPYAFCLSDLGRLARDDLFSQLQVRLARDGTLFQAVVESKAEPIAVSKKDLPRLLRREGILLNTPLFENKSLKIYGRPDGVDRRRGALIPLEIKAHKDIQPMDALELAFYWLLLEPYRTRHLAEAHGILLLRRDGTDEQVEITLQQSQFDRVGELLEEIRNVRLGTALPRSCGRCHVCSDLKPTDALQRARQTEDLRWILGISYKRARNLNNLGIRTWTDLLNADATEVTLHLKSYKDSASVDEVSRWQKHALSHLKQEPIFFGKEPPAGNHFIVLDLEYKPGIHGLVWLIGGAVVVRDSFEFFTFWAEPGEEHSALLQLHNLLAQHPELPILTWSGFSADIPHIRHAMTRTGADLPIDRFLDKHIDVYEYVKGNLCLPIYGLGLKECADYFGIQRTSKIRDGWEADSAYDEYANRADAQRRLILRTELTDYNRDDIRALALIVSKIRDFIPTQQHAV